MHFLVQSKAAVKYRFGFRGKGQFAWLLLRKEYWLNGEVVYTEPIFQIWPGNKNVEGSNV